MLEPWSEADTTLWDHKGARANCRELFTEPPFLFYYVRGWGRGAPIKQSKRKLLKKKRRVKARDTSADAAAPQDEAGAGALPESQEELAQDDGFGPWAEDQLVGNLGQNGNGVLERRATLPNHAAVRRRV